MEYDNYRAAIGMITEIFDADSKVGTAKTVPTCVLHTDSMLCLLCLSVSANPYLCCGKQISHAVSGECRVSLTLLETF